jgi:hypothetical protein
VGRSGGAGVEARPVAARSRPARPRGRPIARLVAVAVLILMAALYVGPVEKYLRVQRELRQQSTLLQQLERVHSALGIRVQALHGRAAIVQCARARGWVFPGEQSFIVTQLPGAGDRQSCS